MSRWDTTTFGGRLQQAAANSGYANANQLAEAIGTSASVASKWWKGETRPDADNLEKIVRLLRVSAHWLLIGEYEGEAERTLAAIRRVLEGGQAPPNAAMGGDPPPSHGEPAPLHAPVRDR